MIRSSRRTTRVFETLALAALALDCHDKPSAPVTSPVTAPDGSASSAQESEHRTPLVVRVDPGLLESKRIEVEGASEGAAGSILSLPGEAVASERGRAEAGSLVSGRVSSLESNVGALVKRGQVLAWVEAPEVARVAAEVIRARARAEAASRKEERQKDLDQQQATSKNALDDAITDARVARADLSAARTLLLALGGVEGLPASPGSENERIASRVAVRSPIDGVISRRDATLGSAVQPERSLFEITSTGQVSTLIRWPESLPQVPRDGQRVQVRSRTAGESRSSCPAKVSGDVGPIDTTTRTRPIRVETTDACPWLVAGAFVTVDVPQTQTQGQGAPTTPAVTIPRRSVVDIHGVPSVFLAKEPLGEFVVRPVRLGPDLGDAVSVEAGLRAGERIAVGGAALLKGELLRSELAE